jgi:protein transport protein DSL1/ZW10
VLTKCPVRQSDTILDIRAIFKSLSTGSLSNHVNTLRRDFLSYFIDHVLKQPYALNIDTSNPNEFKLTLIPSPPNIEDLKSRLNNLSHILDFLFSHLIPYLPESEGIQFTRSLSNPIATSVLNNLLIPSLPSSFGLLPSFLSLLERAVLFEEGDISKLLGKLGNEDIIKTWSNGVSGHYERRRRIEILELARKVIVEACDPNDTFKVVITDDGLETSRSAVPIQDEDFKNDAWGFDEPATSSLLTGNTDSWGFDDDINATRQVEEERRAGFNHEIPLVPEIDEKQDINGDGDVDPADAWGWNEEEDVSMESPQGDETPVAEVVPEDDIWDDPWSDSGEADSQSELQPPTISPSFTSPKLATRLEKSASKNKKHLVPPPSLILQPPPEDKAGHANGAANVIIAVAPKEFHQVPTQTKRFMRMVGTVIDESKLFYASNLFPASKDTVPAPGTILLQSASSILDLYQALYPVKFAKDLELPERGMLFSNSCLYMANAVQQIEDTIYAQPILKDRLSKCRNHLQLLGESWFNETIVQMFVVFLLLCG